MTILQGSDGELRNLLHRQVQVLPVMTIVGMTVVFYLVCLVIRTAWVVHHHDEGAVEILTNRLLIETLRSILLSLTNLLAILITESISEFLYRLAQSKAEHAINLSQHFGLTSLNSSSFLSLSYHLAEFQTILTELAADKAAHLGSIVAGESLRLSTHRHKTIFASQVGNATESTTVVERVLEEELHLRILDALLTEVDDTLKHEVSLLQLVVEEEIILRILHHSTLLVVDSKVGTEHIEAAEHPATARTLLIMNALRRSLDAEMGINRSLIGMIFYQIINIVVSNSIKESLVCSTCMVFLHLLKSRLTDAAPLGLRHHRHGSHQHGSNQ